MTKKNPPPKRRKRSPYAPYLWPVSLGGYAWLDAEASDLGQRTRRRADLLMELEEGDPRSFRESPSRYYDPMEVHTLHRDFADLDTTREGILTFCNEYGMLGAGQAALRKPWRAPSDARRDFEAFDWMGETRDFWAYHVTKVRALLLLSESLESDEPKSAIARLAFDCIRIENTWFLGTGKSKGPKPFGMDLIRLREDDFEWNAVAPFNLRNELVFEYGEWDPSAEGISGVDPLTTTSVDKMREFLTGSINEETRRGTYLRIRGGKEGLWIAPRHLLGAIYAHLAMEVSGQGTPLYRCLGCGKWKPLLHGRRRHCSDYCRVKASRRNNPKAKAQNAGQPSTKQGTKRP